MSVLHIDVWSDIACPWCFVGKRRLEEALAGWEHKDEIEVDVTWRAFELDPSAPVHRDDDASMAEILASKYRVTKEKAEGMLQHMTEVGAKDGLDLRFDRVQRTNTFDGHRMVHLATVRGGGSKGDAMKERLFRAYMTDGENIGDAAVLVRLGREVGLDEKEVQDMLASDLYADDVRSEEEQARTLGITGVPCFVVGQRYGISGAQSADVLRSVLTKAWNERAGMGERDPDEVAAARAKAEACGVDGCAE